MGGGLLDFKMGKCGKWDPQNIRKWEKWPHKLFRSRKFLLKNFGNGRFKLKNLEVGKFGNWKLNNINKTPHPPR